MLTNPFTGDRAAVHNPAYDAARALRGNEPSLEVLFYQLENKSQVGAYLSYFPKYRDYFQKVDARLNSLILHKMDSAYDFHDDTDDLDERHTRLFHRIRQGIIHKNPFFLRQCIHTLHNQTVEDDNSNDTDNSNDKDE